MSRHKYVRLGLSTVTTLLIILVVVGIIGTYSISLYKSNFKFFKEDVVSSFVNKVNKVQESLVMENVAYHTNTQSFNVTLTNTGYTRIQIQNVTLLDATNNVINTNATTIPNNHEVIAFDSEADSGAKSGVSTVTVSHNLGNYPDRLVLVSVSQRFTHTTFATAKYNGVSMTQILDIMSGSSTYRRTTIFGILDANLPDAGNYNAVVTLNNTAGSVVVGVVSFTGVNQTALPSNIATALPSNPVTISINTQTANSWLFDTMTTTGSSETLTADHTEQWNTCSGITSPSICGAGGTLITTDSGSYSMSWDESSSSTGAIGVLEIEPAGVRGITIANQGLHTYQNSGTSISLNFDPGSESNRLLVVALNYNSNPTTNTLKFNGVPLKSAKNYTNAMGYTSQLWYLVNPSSGSHSLAQTQSPSSQMAMGAWSFTGVNQINPIGAIATNGGGAGNAQVSITTTVPNSYVTDTVTDGETGTPTPNNPQVATYTEQGPTSLAGQGSYKSPSTVGVTTMGWTFGSSNTWAEIAMEIIPANSGSTSPSTQINPGSICNILPGQSCTVSLGYHGFNHPVSISVKTARGTTLTTTSVPVVSWFDSSVKFRKEITINSNAVTTTLYNFTALINMTDADLKNNAQNNGNDIVFTSGDGKTLLNYEIENYTGSTGSLVAWVQIPVLYPTPNNVIYMYYGNTNDCSSQNAAGTWDPSYAAVYHLKENPAASNISPTQLDNVQSLATATNSSGVAQLQNFAVGPGVYRLLVVGIIGDNAPVTSVSYGSQSLTNVTSKSNTVTGSIYYLINPTCQAATITVHATASKNMVIGAYSIFGADQTNPIPTVATATSGSTNPVSISITNAHTGSVVLDLAGVANSGGFTATQSQQWNVTDASISSASSKAGPLASTTTTTFTRNTKTVGQWIEMAIEVQSPYVPNITIDGTVVTAKSDSSKEPWTSLTLPSVTVSSNINRLLLVATASDEGNVTSVTYGGIPLNHVEGYQEGSDGSSAIDISFWDLVNPPIGTADIVITAPNNNGPLGIGAYSLYGVDTANPIPRTNSTSGTCPPPNNPCIRITLINLYKYSWVIDNSELNTNSGDLLTSPKQTQQWSMTLPDSGSPSGEVAFASSKNTSPLAATGTHTYFTWKNGTNGGDKWGAVAVEVKNSTSLTVPPIIYDSTSNVNNLTPNSMLATDQILGQIDGSLNFRGNPSSLSINNPNAMPANNAAQTVSFWFWVPSNPGSGNQDMFSLQKSTSSSSVQIGFRAPNFVIWNWAGTSLVSTSPPTAGKWHYVVYTYDGTTHRLYIDGVQQTTSITSPDSASPNSLYLAAYSGGQYYTGQLDELRISTTTHSAAWIATEYYNQANPSLFYAVGPPEASSDIRTSR